MAAKIFRSSDLANSNYLASARGNNPNTLIAATIKPEVPYAGEFSVYPNPVTANQLTVQFHKVPAGNYTVELRDVLGRTVMQKKITVNTESQVQPLSLNEGDAKGVYMISVVDGRNQSVFSQKVVVQ